MEVTGRRAGAWRCPACRGIFLDVETMRRRPHRLPVWAPVVMSVAASVLATVITQLLKRRRARRDDAAAAPETRA